MYRGRCGKSLSCVHLPRAWAEDALHARVGCRPGFTADGDLGLIGDRFIASSIRCTRPIARALLAAARRRSLRASRAVGPRFASVRCRYAGGTIKQELLIRLQDSD